MLDDYVADDNLVRAVDAFVDGLDLGELGFGRCRAALRSCRNPRCRRASGPNPVREEIWRGTMNVNPTVIEQGKWIQWAMFCSACLRLSVPLDQSPSGCQKQRRFPRRRFGMEAYLSVQIRCGRADRYRFFAQAFQGGRCPGQRRNSRSYFPVQPEE
jgi:hypothetical protein